jgi:hypothetical protein
MTVVTNRMANFWISWATEQTISVLALSGANAFMRLGFIFESEVLIEAGDDDGARDYAVALC